MSDLARARFYVIATTGYSMHARRPAPSTSYAVLDRLFLHREVWLDFARVSLGLPDYVRRMRAEAKADELNRKHAA